jgi:Tfp pilus assembly protein PilF
VTAYRFAVVPNPAGSPVAPGSANPGGWFEVARFDVPCEEPLTLLLAVSNTSGTDTRTYLSAGASFSDLVVQAGSPSGAASGRILGRPPSGAPAAQGTGAGYATGQATAAYGSGQGASSRPGTERELSDDEFNRLDRELSQSDAFQDPQRVLAESERTRRRVPGSIPGDTPGGAVRTGAGDPPQYASGLSLLNSGDLRGALAEFNRALDQAPGHYKTLVGRAQARLWLNDLAGARDDWAAALGLDSSDINVRRYRILMELCLGNYALARAEAEKLLQIGPDDPANLLLQGQSAIYANDTETVRKAFGRVLQIDPNRARTLYDEGTQAMTRGIPMMGALQFTTVLWMDPNLYQAWYGYGDAMARMGMKEQAINAYESYLKYDQTSEWARTAREQIGKLRGQ